MPPAVDGRERVGSLKKLGVILQNNISMKEHVISTCNNMVYALNLLRSHGLKQDGLKKIFNSKILSKILYASPAWFGFAGQEERTRINSFLQRSKRLAFILRMVKCLRSSAQMPMKNCLKKLNQITIMFFTTYYQKKTLPNIIFIIGCIIIFYRLKMTEIWIPVPVSEKLWSRIQPRQSNSSSAVTTITIPKHMVSGVTVLYRRMLACKCTLVAA